LHKLIRILRNSFNGEDDSFIIWTAFKVVGIAACILFFIYLMFYNLMELNNLYFISMGFSGSDLLKSVFFDYLTRNVYSTLPFVLVFFITLFFGGLYIAKSLLRPFDSIAKYSEEAIDRINNPYNGHHFSGQQLLASFSEFFFSYIIVCRKEKKLSKNIIPLQYTRVHAPVFDKVFFFHFSLILGVICIFTSWFIQAISYDLHANMVELAIQTLKTSNTGITSFLSGQQEILQTYTNIAILLTFLFYIILGFHLYSKVAGAAFGFFATMRSFMKGNFSARVHLIGYNHVRPQSRRLNKFLDYIQKKIPEKNDSID
jgi:hypothetical protein